MKTSELEKRIKTLRLGEVIRLGDINDRDRAYSAARTLKRLELIDFEITCPTVEGGGWVAMRKPK